MSETDNAPLVGSEALRVPKSSSSSSDFGKPDSVDIATSSRGASTKLRFGPWTHGISEVERAAGLRALAALVAVHCGSKHQAVDALRLAESNPDASEAAREAFDGLPALKQCRIIGTYAMVMAPARGRAAP